MKKIYSIVLMATMLLVGTNLMAETVEVGTDAALRQAITDAVPGTPLTITLSTDIPLSSGKIDISDGKDITLNLNGKNLTSCSDPGFYILQGKLSFTGNGHYSSTGDCVVLKGSDDPTASNYSVCYVGPDVTVESLGVGTYYNVWITKTANNHAYGAKVIVDGTLTGIPAALYINGQVQDKTGNIAEFYVNEGAHVYATGETKAGIYAAGYAIWHIAGTVQAATGIYAKSGEIHIDGGTIIANAATYTEAQPNGNGYTGGQGCAIIYDSKNGYAGDMQLTVTGDAKIESQTTDGYAIQEVKTDATDSKTESITIESGTINGSVEMTAEVAETVKVNGTITGGTFDTDVTQYLSNVTGVITPVVDEETGKTTYVVEEKPAESDPWLADIATADAESYVRLEDDYSATLAKDAQAKYLVMQDNAKIIIPDGKKLTAGEVVMGQNTVIEVMAGGKLIITDAQGLVANFASNIVLHATQGNQSTFIMTPDVKSNKHPKATVELVSKSYYIDEDHYLNQRFGIPTIGALESITADYPTRIWGYFNAHWDLIGTIIPGTPFDASVMDQPFAYYQMNSNNPSAGTVVTMAGRLVGIEDPQIELIANNWNTFSNSFMANINATKMMDMFEGHPNIDATIQTFKPTSTDKFAWTPFNRSNILMGENTDVEPMQAFIVKNNGAADALQINYEEMVWEPFEASLAPAAPRKRAALDMTTARIQVSNAEGVYDYVTLLADNQFSAEYENGYDAEHVMNNTLDLYTVGVKNLATMATDNLDNTVIGMTCAEAGEYTISFSHINGDNLTLIDRATGARIAMVEGNTYDFTVEAGEANRFEIVASAKLPTDIENTEAKNVKGAVYTITGQYVGSVENWNVLPAGVYVIDGVKCVK